MADSSMMLAIFAGATGVAIATLAIQYRGIKYQLQRAERLMAEKLKANGDVLCRLLDRTVRLEARVVAAERNPRELATDYINRRLDALGLSPLGRITLRAGQHIDLTALKDSGDNCEALIDNLATRVAQLELQSKREVDSHG